MDHEPRSQFVCIKEVAFDGHAALVKPDPGPKMYVAYGFAFERTNLIPDQKCTWRTAMQESRTPQRFWYI